MTNYERIKNMSVEEIALFLMKVNGFYSDCMVGIDDCKYPEIGNNCTLCLKQWLESEVEE